ncbi:hypothetical protein BS78_06G038200 [Paspalum vaginatum]|nr:hypothetical protein BS78_06G038200 [Paspalum vaginatum]
MAPPVIETSFPFSSLASIPWPPPAAPILPASAPPPIPAAAARRAHPCRRRRLRPSLLPPPQPIPAARAVSAHPRRCCLRPSLPSHTGPRIHSPPWTSIIGCAPRRGAPPPCTPPHRGFACRPHSPPAASSRASKTAARCQGRGELWGEQDGTGTPVSRASRRARRARRRKATASMGVAAS